MQAGAELELIGSALAIETTGEALEQLLDLWWDYEVNGPYMVESGPLWSRMGYVDQRLDAFRDLARAEFDLEPAHEDTRRWLETPCNQPSAPQTAPTIPRIRTLGFMVPQSAWYHPGRTRSLAREATMGAILADQPPGSAHPARAAASPMRRATALGQA